MTTTMVRKPEEIPLEDISVLGRTARIIGAPGGGKTWLITDLVSRCVYEHGTKSVTVCSFTTTAAQEIGSRIRSPIPPEQIGTVHALGYQLLDKPTMYHKHIEDWNSRYPHWGITAKARFSTEAALDDGPVKGAVGDELMSLVGVNRNRMLPVDQWHDAQAESFHCKWEEWKREVGVIDFVDQLAMAIELGGPAPGNPRVLFVDEAQDMSKLQAALVRQWSKHAAWTIMAGDGNQQIFSWAGASDEAFLLWETDYTLPWNQSHRVPRGVTDLAVEWINRAGAQTGVELQPVDRDGVVEVMPRTDLGGWPFSQRLAAHVANGETAMIIAPCAYQLSGALKRMRADGIPFHNEGRLSQGAWNPLPRRARGVSSADRLMAFLRPHEKDWGDKARMWTATDLWHFIEPMKTRGVLKSGAKDWLQEHHSRLSSRGSLPFNDAMPNSRNLNQLPGVLYFFQHDPEIHRALYDGNLQWWLNGLLAARRKAVEFPVRVYEKSGPKALREKPLITIGTIHSVKGMEAEHVYIVSDLSARGAQQWARRGEDRDALLRLYYVAVTRAQQAVHILPPETGHHVDLARVAMQFAGRS